VRHLLRQGVQHCIISVTKGTLLITEINNNMLLIDNSTTFSVWSGYQRILYYNCLAVVCFNEIM